MQILKNSLSYHINSGLGARLISSPYLELMRASKKKTRPKKQGSLDIAFSGFFSIGNNTQSGFKTIRLRDWLAVNERKARIARYCFFDALNISIALCSLRDKRGESFGIKSISY